MRSYTTTLARQDIRDERNAFPHVQEYALCLDCTEPKDARCHRLPARDMWDIPQHAYVAPHPIAPRLAHCTPVWGGHSLACDRDGTYCGQNSTHDGPCTPHGTRTPR